MTTKKPTCKIGLKKNIIAKDVFEREIALCRNLSKENGGKCGWGVCKDCGVLPFLIKLHKGVLLEDPLEIVEEKRVILS
ncbi:MAG: hypothetical protein Q8P56_00080 [Candidatus Uhrbacteria bacterium]|nr:hypothetical protein [Candidatus Uhrbacteria bacterium]